MAWQPDPSPDCIEDLIQAAQASGDEYLTALLTSAARRLSRFIP